MSDVQAGETTTETTEPANGAPQKHDNGMVPRTVLNEARAELRALKAQAEAWAAKDAELTTLKASAAAWEAEKSTLAERVALARAGVVDDDHETALRAEWSKLAEDVRPASMADLWAEVKSKPIEEVPRLLRGFLLDVAPPSASQPGKPKPPPAAPGSRPGTDTEDALSRAHSEARNAYQRSPSPATMKAYVEAGERLQAAVAARKARTG